MEISSGDKIITECYCSDCAKKNPEVKRVLDTFSKEKKLAGKEKKCSFCGTTLRDLKQSSFTGCAKCYEVFRPYIRKKINEIHRHFFHRGKVPSKDSLGVSFFTHLEDWMRMAVVQENFEEIKKIKKELEKFLKNGY
ncbi:MAG: hypothetical protein N2115_07185 [bacterium]|nr:hypothetical protein [bacterium]